MINYLFYDLETTGLNKAFDQILQFAGIRTDQSFNELERHSFLIKLRNDVIYAPEALITNRISIAEANQSGICEYEAIKTIHQLINTPDTLSIGYNSLGFDDEFLRFSFYRNLLPPYTHQYQNGCRRMDMLPITVIYSLYKRDVIEWPELNGNPTLRLEHLSATNNLTAGRAHDALFDVEATVELARRFAGATDIWNYLCGYFDKAIDRNRMQTLPSAFNGQNPGNFTQGLLVGAEFGAKRNYQAPVLSLGASVPYANQQLWLRLDLPELSTTTVDSIPDTTWIIRKKYGEPGIILPPLERYWHRVNQQRRDTVSTNLAWLQSNPELFQKIIDYHRHYEYPYVPNVDLDAALYQIGFFTSREQALGNEFHRASLPDKIKVMEKMPTPHTRQIACRILGRNYFDQLPGHLQAEYTAFLETINPAEPSTALIDYKGERRSTPTAALSRIEQLRNKNELDPEQFQLLHELQNYLMDRFT